MTSYINFPNRAILHIDGDAFFAACEQSRDPKLRGRPVITGGERGIAASMSYEAKALGITRGMRVHEMKALCPDIIILTSDYETYSVLSQRFYDIVRRYTSEVEEYSIDECFADLTGMDLAWGMSHADIAKKIQKDLERELGFTFSLGLAPNKVLAKVGSKWNKPNGTTIIPDYKIKEFITELPVGKLWGIGPSTTSFLNQRGVDSAYDFSLKEEYWAKENLAKPFYEIWQELQGRFIFPIVSKPKDAYASIQKVKTFTPPSTDKKFVFSQLAKNIENACIKARRYDLTAKNVVIFLRTQTFFDNGLKIKLPQPTVFPHEIITVIEPYFDRLFRKGTPYRSTGITLTDLVDGTIRQQDLFGATARSEKISCVYDAIDKLRGKYGKHTAYMGASFLAHNFSQHQGVRGKSPERKKNLFKGETARKRLNIPMFLGEVS